MVKKATMPAKALADYILMPRTLTAENGAKALLSGEFTILHTATCTACSFDEPQEDCEVCAGEVEYTEIIPVDWSTIKDIYATAVDGLAALPAAEQQETVKLNRADAEVIASFFETGGSIRLVDAGYRIAHQLRAQLAEVVAPAQEAQEPEQQPVATIQLPDPSDERDGPWFSREDLNRLGYLPAGTKLYTAPVAQTCHRPELSQASADVLAERRRQVEAEGFAPECDDQYRVGELATAAGCYLLFSDAYPNEGQPPAGWPWADSWWKPTTYRQNQIKAGALILAEIERLDRASLWIDQEAGQ
ncbi:hypothetical protein ACFOJE_01540 [Azotobacter bryophylli]|uniref:Uncharacterized protein n=1 Tax=Azotobacter bryophylli TaxID=1986537 RepID=A0ABV7AN52_9GAMM